MNNITTLHPASTLSVGQSLRPTSAGGQSYTLLAVCPRDNAGEGTYATCVVLHVSLNSYTPFATHVAIDTPDGWAFENGHYHRTLPEAYEDFVGRCPTQWAD